MTIHEALRRAPDRPHRVIEHFSSNYESPRDKALYVGKRILQNAGVSKKLLELKEVIDEGNGNAVILPTTLNLDGTVETGIGWNFRTIPQRGVELEHLFDAIICQAIPATREVVIKSNERDELFIEGELTGDQKDEMLENAIARAYRSPLTRPGTNTERPETIFE